MNEQQLTEMAFQQTIQNLNSRLAQLEFDKAMLEIQLQQFVGEFNNQETGEKEE